MRKHILKSMIFSIAAFALFGCSASRDQADAVPASGANASEQTTGKEISTENDTREETMSQTEAEKTTPEETSPEAAATAETESSRTSSENFEVSSDMIPYDTDMMGARAGYFFIPINDKIYRFENEGTLNKDQNKDRFICSFESEELGVSCEYEVYSVDDHPDCSVLYCLSREKQGAENEMKLVYKPALKTGEEAIERATADGFVIMTDGSVTCGKETWLEFYDKVVNGQPASVRIGMCYYQIGNMSADAKEATKDDYPVLYLSELVFDGEGYVISPLHFDGDDYIVREEVGVDNPVRAWKYLLHLTGSPSSGQAAFTHYDKYVLCDRDDVTWEDLMRGTLSSQMGDYIPYTEVFNEYTWKENSKTD